MTRNLLLSIGLLLALPELLLAAPALEEYRLFQQPDGSSFAARKRGDEFQNWVETESGHTILRNRETGFWEYAVQVPDGNLLPSGERVAPNRVPPAGLSRQAKPPRNMAAERAQSLVMQEMYLQRLPSPLAQSAGRYDAALAAAPGDWVPVPVSGPRNIIVILVSFLDRVLVTSPESWGSAIFSTAPGAKSVANYYSDNSFGTLNVRPVAHSQPGNPEGVVTVAVPHVHPDNGTSELTWVTAAIDAADAYVNFALLDANGNGYIDRSEAIVYLIPAGYEQTATHNVPSVWAHASWFTGGGLTAAGKLFPVYAMSGELNHYNVQLPIGVMAHELGHQICGLPDLYDTSNRNQGMGQFSLMASGGWGTDSGEQSGTTPVNLDAWSREYLGWSAPQVPASPSTLALAHPLSAPGAAYKFISPEVSSTEYFLLENRQPVGWDRGLRGGMVGFGSDWTGGLLLTHIDITAGTVGNNNINSYYNDAGHQGVIPVQASTVSCDMLVFGATCRGSASTLYFAGNNSSWTPVTNPDSSFHAGTVSSFNLLNISVPSPVMTADYLFLSPEYRTITVVKSGAGSGSVLSSPAGISCGSGCVSPFAVGSTVTLKAIPEPGYRLISWTGGGCSGTAACVFTVESDTQVRAEFGPSSRVDIASGAVPRPIYDNTTVTSVLTVPTGVCGRVTDTDIRVYVTHSWIGELKISLFHNDSGRSADLFLNSCSSNDFIDAWFDDQAATTLECPPTGRYAPASSLSVFDGLDPAGTWTLHVSDNGIFDIGMLREWGASFGCLNSLSVTLAGSGGGAVVSTPQGIDPPGLSCPSGTCSTLFAAAENVTLLPVPDSYSTFGGWAGDCSGLGVCSVIMNLPRSAGASFVAAPLVVNQESGQSFASLGNAYAAAGTGDTLRARIVETPLQEGDLLFGRGIQVTVRGGFDAGYSSSSGHTVLQGTLTMRAGQPPEEGSLRVERLLLRSSP